MNKYLFLFTVFTTLSLTGCFSLQKLDQQVLEKNQQLADKVQQELGEEIAVQQEQIKDRTKEVVKTGAEKTISFIAKSLTDSVKEEIDQWLERNGLNQYGDPKETMYAGGTPLFDETSGQTKDKYEYILEKNPELIDELNLGK